jgi:hypothetical protein
MTDFAAWAREEEDDAQFHARVAARFRHFGMAQEARRAGQRTETHRARARFWRGEIPCGDLKHERDSLGDAPIARLILREYRKAAEKEAAL